MQQVDRNVLIDVNEDPFQTIAQWLEEAKSSELNDADAMSLATVDDAGLPNLRTVLMRGMDAPGADKRGFVFYTNFESTKGEELSAHSKAALLFHWKSLRRQIRIRGDVSMVRGEEADAYFLSRPEGSQIGAWASDQSRPLDRRATLEKRVLQIAEKYRGGDVPRPPNWSGYRLTPCEIEFWKNGEYRLHHRLVYRRANESDPWTTSYLYP